MNAYLDWHAAKAVADRDGLAWQFQDASKDAEKAARKRDELGEKLRQANEAADAIGAAALAARKTVET
jgi:hypothetical protein